MEPRDPLEQERGITEEMPAVDEAEEPQADEDEFEEDADDVDE
jgi:hypothetical protein